jgi:hypothetical protein
MSDELNKIFENDQKKYRVLQSVYNLSNPDKFVGVSVKQVADFTQIPVSEVKEILNRLCDFDKSIDHPTNTSGFMSNNKTVDKIKQYKKLEIEEIIRGFRQIANDLIYMNSSDEMSYLERFISFIESKPIIFNFIQDNNRVRQFEIERVIDRCVQLVHTYVEIPKGKNEEIAFAYQLLKYGLENFNAYYVFTIQIPAYGGRKEGVLKFNKTIVNYFCNHIDHYLTTMLNKLGNDGQQHPHTYIGTQNNSTTNIRDIRDSVVNLGTISGNVTKSINQLRESNTSNSEQLADLLSQLKSCIESENELNSEDKEEALEQVNALAEAGQNPQDGAMQKAAKTAIRVLKGIKDELPPTVALIQGLNQLIPAVQKFFSFFHHT